MMPEHAQYFNRPTFQSQISTTTYRDTYRSSVRSLIPPQKSSNDKRYRKSSNKDAASDFMSSNEGRRKNGSKAMQAAR